MNQIKAPFTEEQVLHLNNYQNAGIFHEFTCCSPEEKKECQRRSGESNGTLKATTEGWVCPCGKYTQDWAHEFMASPLNGVSVWLGKK